MKKYIIILFSMLLLASSITNAQIIKRSKQKTEQATRTKQNNQPKQEPIHNKLDKSKQTKKKKESGQPPKEQKTKQGSNKPSMVFINTSCNTDGELYIDGEYFGRPSGRYQVSTGSHNVRVVASGYYELRKEIHVSPSRLTFDFQLTRDYSNRNRNL